MIEKVEHDLPMKPVYKIEYGMFALIITDFLTVMSENELEYFKFEISKSMVTEMLLVLRKKRKTAIVQGLINRLERLEIRM
jgi:hypothetical protein